MEEEWKKRIWKGRVSGTEQSLGVAEASKRKLTLESHEGYIGRETITKTIKQGMVSQFWRDMKNLIPLFLQCKICLWFLHEDKGQMKVLII